mgnify:CR=1 FL=1
MIEVRILFIVVLGLLLFAGVASAAPTVAVAPFANHSGSFLLNLEDGVAGMLVERLEGQGYLVIPPGAMRSWIQQWGLPEWDPNSWRQAARVLGGQAFLAGTIHSLTTNRITITLGFVSITGISSQAQLSLVVEDLGTGASLAELRGSGEGEGEAKLSFDLGALLTWPSDVCSGGFKASQAAYYPGEPVLIGYLDPAPSNSFYIVIHPQGAPAPTWTSGVVASSGGSPCVSWTWNQMFGLFPALPGTYQADLYQLPGPVLISSLTFSILPGPPSPWAVEITAGEEAFSATPWYQALDAALEELMAQLLPVLETHWP